MIPKLYLDSEQFSEYETGYIGPLSDAVSCQITEGTDGTYHLELQYPVGGKHWEDLEVAKAVVCKPNDYTREQPFTIKKISKPMNGLCDVSADHISYDLNNYVSMGLPWDSVSSFIRAYKWNTVYCPFHLSADFEKTIPTVEPPEPPRVYKEILFGKNMSFVSTLGGEFSFDRLNIIAHEHRGSDKGVRIQFGKNLLALTQSREIRDFATFYYPYWYKPSSNQDPSDCYMELTRKVVNYPVEEFSDVFKILPLDLTKYFETKPTEYELTIQAEKWMNQHMVKAPPDNFKINFVQLEKTKEYEQFAAAESVQLYDTVTIVVPHMHLNKKMRVIMTTYDVLRERYSSIEIGSHIDKFADTILKIGGAE